MDPRSLTRLLAIVERELAADDARIELGGRAPASDLAVFALLGGGLRVVAIFDSPPPDLAAKQAKLDLLVETFRDVAAPLPSAPRMPRPPIESALDEVLDDVRAHAHARRALVIDDSSPVIWGTSLSPRDGLDVDVARSRAELWRRVERAGLDPEDVCGRSPDELAALDGTVEPRLLRELVRAASADGGADDDPAASERARERRLDQFATARAIDWVRSDWAREAHDRRFVHREGGVATAARSFATTYRLVTVHRGPFSELHAEAAIAHALPIVEGLVLRLPPVDPGHGEGRVVRLRRRKV